MIIIAPRYIKVEGPLLFLAGPILGAVNWQYKAIHYIRHREPGLHIASPRRSISIGGDFPEGMYDEQLDWEHYYIKRAGDDGVMVFWLAKERYHKCHRAYAQTTRFEIGEASADYRLTGIKMVVGIEKGFSGGEYIRKTLAKKCPGVPLCDTLGETCEAAIRIIKRNIKGGSDPPFFCCWPTILATLCLWWTFCKISDILEEYESCRSATYSGLF